MSYRRWMWLLFFRVLFFAMRFPGFHITVWVYILITKPGKRM